MNIQDKPVLLSCDYWIIAISDKTALKANRDWHYSVHPGLSLASQIPQLSDIKHGAQHKFYYLIIQLLTHADAISDSMQHADFRCILIMYFFKYRVIKRVLNRKSNKINLLACFCWPLKKTIGSSCYFST